MSNTVALVPVYAAANSTASEQAGELPEITLDKQLEGQVSIKQNSDTDTLTTKQKVVQFINQLIPYYAQNGKQQGPQWLRTTDINLTFTDDLKPMYSLETLQPFTKEVTDGKLGFWQGRYAYQSGAAATANLGIGLRWLSEDKTSLTGINTFYDYAFQHNLSRVGVGAEYFNKQAEYRANFYIPTSGDRQTEATSLVGGMLYSYIRAVSGFDYEVGTTLANAPWLSVYASGFHYDNKYKEDENGYRLRSKMQLTPRFSMEMGYTHSNLSSGSLYGKALYQLADTAGPALRGGNAQERSNDISHKLLKKVQRENDIKTETFTKLVAYTGSLSVTVTNSSGTALLGARVQVYQNGNPVGATAVTDAAGIAVVSGLAAGMYNVQATYFSASATITAMNVQKDQITTVPPIALAVLGGRAIINVLDNGGAGIGGATVTAEEASGLHGAADKSLFDRILGVKTAYAASGFKVTAVTDASGIATFTNLPPGNYKFTVTVSGKEMKSLAVAVPDGSTSNATVVLPASGGNIVAMIIDAVSKAVINGATVELKNGSTIIDTKTTGSDGTAVFSGLTAGSTYTIAASAANYSGKSINTAVTDKETIAAAIELAPQAPQTGSAKITVTDGTNPVSGATVSVMVNGQAQTATTVANGEATFASIPTGTYTFTAIKADYGSGTASDVVITNGATATAAIALTRQTGSAVITVTDGTNLLSGATVAVTVNGQSRTATTGANGVANFADLPPGSYSFTATKDGYTVGTLTVSITAGGTASEVITLTWQSGGVYITVTDASNNAPLGGAAVSIIVDGRTFTNTTSSFGIQEWIGVPIGTYTITVTKNGYADGTANVTVTSGATAAATVIMTSISPPGDARITVTDGTNPLSGATVAVTVNGQPRTAQTLNGVITFADLPPGTYSFGATKDNYSSTSIEGVVITSGATTNATIKLTRQTGKMTIKVRDQNLTGTVAQIEDANVTVTGSGIAQGVTRTVQSDSTGNAAFSALPTGSYTFSITKSGYTSGSGTFTITNAYDDSQIVRIAQSFVNIGLYVKEYVESGPESMLGGVTVTITNGTYSVTQTTTADVLMSFTNVPAGTCTFTLTKSGYTTITQYRVMPDDGTAPIFIMYKN